MKKIAVICSTTLDFKHFIENVVREDHKNFVCVMNPDHMYGSEFQAVIRSRLHNVNPESQYLYGMALSKVR